METLTEMGDAFYFPHMAFESYPPSRVKGQSFCQVGMLKRTERRMGRKAAVDSIVSILLAMALSCPRLSAEAHLHQNISSHLDLTS